MGTVETFVIEADCNVPKLGWTSNVVLGKFDSNNDSMFIYSEE